MKKLILIIIGAIMLTSCNGNLNVNEISDSGVSKAHTKVKTDENGNTIEQRNIMNRLKRDNEIGNVKHLYIISSYTGDVMEYSTVLGKVTSGSKRLSPKTVLGYTQTTIPNNYVNIGNENFITDEVLDDGGTYGESANYIYWFDAQDNYHQYFPSGGTYLHISDRPLRIKKVSMTFESISETTK
jgi:hypothetical protein